MTDFLILAITDRLAVRGVSTKGHALEPRETATTGVYALPLAVMADPHHARHLTRLGGLTRGRVTWPEPEPEDLR